MNKAETSAELIDPAPNAAGWGVVEAQDRQRRSCRRRVRPVLGASASFLKRLKHTPCLALRGTGIANTARREVARACIQLIGQCPGSLPAALLVHAPHHSRHLVSGRYHIQGTVQPKGMIYFIPRLLALCAIWRQSIPTARE